MNGKEERTKDGDLLARINDANDFAELRHERHVSESALADLETLLPGSSPSFEDETVPGNHLARRPTLESATEAAEVVKEGLGMFQGNGARLAALTIVSLVALIAFAIWQLKDRLPVVP